MLRCNQHLTIRVSTPIIVESIGCTKLPPSNAQGEEAHDLAAVGAAGQTVYGFTGESGAVAVWLAVLPFLLMVVAASFMLSGREQFVEEDFD